ncbi:MAG: ribonuclease P protein component [Thermoleophilia bacterium]|nr:ribonuclease P protein component [Thermoleophilia bacterium]
MKRRNRLSRSRDFDAVYRHGRSVSSRYLVLYSFPREGADGETRLGLAVSRKVGDAVTRNRVKRSLRAAFDAVSAGVPGGCDHVVVVRPGFGEAAEARGAAWVEERLREVFERSAGARAGHP